MSRRDISERVSKCRKERRLTTKYLAERAGIPEDVIIQLEGGLYKNMTGRLWLLLARALRVDFSWMAGDID